MRALLPLRAYTIGSYEQPHAILNPLFLLCPAILLLRGRWGRDWHVRLFQRSRRFVETRVHEHLERVPDTGELSGCIRHAPYRDLTHHLEKIILYARWGAQDLHARGRRATAWDLTARPLWRFARDYILAGSFLDGRVGIVASVLTAYSGFLKYAYLWDLGARSPTA